MPHDLDSPRWLYDVLLYTVKEKVSFRLIATHKQVQSVDRTMPRPKRMKAGTPI